MQTKFLLLLGPSGVGKTTIIQRLRQLDDRFVYISPYITRKLRRGETDKVSVSGRKLDKLVRDEKILVVNQLYDIRYATPREPIEQAFEAEKFPLLDWPIDRLDVMEQHFQGRLFKVYVETDPETLRLRLAADKRDPTQSRVTAGLAELEKLARGEYDTLFDYRIANPTGEVDMVVQKIYEQYLQAIG
ncbi:MAG TPA: AAA family ATPase [Candidatus Paceibacterota bacterium]|nr:AAA family ATPase [Candidatus Paceibacterota bacterium]